MSNKSIKTLKGLKFDELTLKANELTQSIFKARFQKSTGQLKDVSSIWKLRKELARVKTVETALKGKL